jgi:hypothetical protein
MAKNNFKKHKSAEAVLITFSPDQLKEFYDRIQLFGTIIHGHGDQYDDGNLVAAAIFLANFARDYADKLTKIKNRTKGNT